MRKINKTGLIRLNAATVYNNLHCIICTELTYVGSAYKGSAKNLYTLPHNQPQVINYWRTKHSSDILRGR